MQAFVIRYRRPWQPFWRKIKIIGMGYNAQIDRLSVDLPDGSVREFAKWSTFHCKLGADWIAFTKKKMEAAAGQPVVVNRPGV